MPQKKKLAKTKGRAKKLAKARITADQAIANVLRHAETLPSVRKEILDERCPVRTCYVCQRTSRDLQMVGPSKFRHDDCNPGSPNWADYWETLKAGQKTDAGQFIYQHAKERATA
jgi:hypothetical protein